MPRAKLYTPARLTLHAVAADYLKANPTTKHHQLMQLFALTTLEARDVGRSVKAQDAADARTMQAALAWAIENMAGNTQVGERFGLSDGNARRIAASAKAVNAEKIAAAKARNAEACQFADDNPEMFAKDVAEQFGVSFHMIEKHRTRRRQNQRFAEIASERPATQRRPRSGGLRLYAVLPDGTKVDPRAYRNLPKGATYEAVMV